MKYLGQLQKNNEIATLVRNGKSLILNVEEYDSIENYRGNYSIFNYLHGDQIPFFDVEILCKVYNNFVFTGYKNIITMHKVDDYYVFLYYNDLFIHYQHKDEKIYPLHERLNLTSQGRNLFPEEMPKLPEDVEDLFTNDGKEICEEMEKLEETEEVKKLNEIINKNIEEEAKE